MLAQIPVHAAVIRAKLGTSAAEGALAFLKAGPSIKPTWVVPNCSVQVGPDVGRSISPSPTKFAPEIGRTKRVAITRSLAKSRRGKAQRGPAQIWSNGVDSTSPEESYQSG